MSTENDKLLARAAAGDDRAVEKLYGQKISPQMVDRTRSEYSTPRMGGAAGGWVTHGT